MTILMVLAAASAQAAPDPALSAAANKAFLANFAKQQGVQVRPDGLEYRILHNGFGSRPSLQDYATVYYTGKLINGKVFDGTEEGMPSRFKVNSLIAGWSEALSLMRVGDKWEVVIPSSLAYGEAGTPDGAVPPNQTLIFTVELVKVVPPKLRPADPNNPDDKHAGEDLGPDDGDN
ncbi:MAG: FKBP-type peptidyl-prolyl cis-trans isomerase [Alphaproteobacteria bacterium]|nr:FKBP-type peptidyl-prolyl cis-trans isomerase [Alphaproteobacteria bacterium]